MCGVVKRGPLVVGTAPDVSNRTHNVLPSPAGTLDAMCGGVKRGLLVVGHGSRREEANETVRALARDLAVSCGDAGSDGDVVGADGEAGTGGGGPRPSWADVQPAFLEVVQPDIATGYATLAGAGCTDIVVHPFFLFDGNHTRHDIPAALAEAQARHPATRWTLTEPLGLHPGVVAAVRDRIRLARTR
jgi:sirohydrochlorin cobaltochelatase